MTDLLITLGGVALFLAAAAIIGVPAYMRRPWNKEIEEAGGIAAEKLEKIKGNRRENDDIGSGNDERQNE